MSTLQNPLLQQAEQQLEERLAPQTLENYNKIIVAGLKAGLAGGPKSILAGLVDRENPLQDCAYGAVNMVISLSRMSRGTMPTDAMVAAAMGLLLQALDFADTAKIIKVGDKELAQATQIMLGSLARALQISPEMLTRAAEMTQGVIDNPEQLEALKQKLQPSGGEARRGLINSGGM